MGDDLYFEAFRAHLGEIGLDRAVIEEVIACYCVKRYPKDACFSIAGEVSDSVGFVMEGLFYMSVTDGEGTLFVKEFMRRHDFLLAVYQPEQESTVDIRAICDSVVLEARYSDIRELSRKHAALEDLSRRRMEWQVESIYARMTQQATLTAFDCYALFRQHFGREEDVIPQYLISAYLGVTPTQLSRIRAQLRCGSNAAPR